MDIQTGLPRTPSTWSVVWAIVLMILGVAAVALPAAVSISVTFILAWVLIVVGITHLASAWSAPTVGAVVWKMSLALLYIVVGVTVLRHPLWGLTSVTLVIGAACLAEGILALAAYFAEPRPSLVNVLGGAVSILLGVMIWNQWPSSSLWVIGTLVGINLLFAGATHLALAIGERRLGRVDQM